MMKNCSFNRPKIDSLQVLRAGAFLGIFLNHAEYFIKWPVLGVSIFFVMSGFLMTYRYEPVEFAVSLKNNFSFSWNKIKKLYPLHILTMICQVILVIITWTSEDIKISTIIDLIGKIVLNVMLMQTWIPHSSVNVSLNGVAWYLSVTFFLYFMFPWIKKIVEQEKISKLCTVCGVIMAGEVITCIPFIMFLGKDSPIYIWFMYCFPIFRLGDFFVGCVLKRIYFETNLRKIGVVKGTTYEVLAVLFTGLVFILLKKEYNSIVAIALHNWTTVYILISAVWVLLFAANKGLITKLLYNKLTMYVGNISVYAFLIHYVITQYTSKILQYMNVEIDVWYRTFLVFAELVISILLSEIYKRFHESIIAKKMQERK